MQRHGPGGMAREAYRQCWVYERRDRAARLWRECAPPRWQTQKPKAEVMRQAARELVSQSRSAMESAARNGLPPPAWVQAFMSPTVWNHERQLCQEFSHLVQFPDDLRSGTDQVGHTGGSSWFLSICIDLPGWESQIRKRGGTASQDAARHAF